MQRTRLRAGLLAGAAVLALVLQPAAGLAEAAFSEEVEEVTRSLPQRVAGSTFDVIVLRPTGFLVMLVGAALFVPAAVTTSPGGLTPMREALDTFVMKPGNYLLTRPLGEF